jgi:hypothetical protein
MHFTRGENGKLQFFAPATKEEFWTKRFASRIVQLEFNGRPFIVYRGSKDDVDFRWDIGAQVGEYLHDKITYPRDETTFFGILGKEDVPNSDAGAYTLGTIMLPEGVGEGEHDWNLITPGWGYYLFRSPELDFKNAPKVKNRFILGRSGGESFAEAEFRNNAPIGERFGQFGDPARLTQTTARRAIEAAKADDAFSKRYVSNNRDAVDYMHALHRAAYPEPDTVVGPRVRPDAGDRSAGGMSVQTRDATPARQALEAAKSDDGFVKRYLDGDRNAFAQMQSLIQAAYPEPDASGSNDTANDASSPMFQPWTPETATEGLQPWMRDQYPDWLRGS